MENTQNCIKRRQMYHNRVANCCLVVQKLALQDHTEQQAKPGMSKVRQISNIKNSVICGIS